MPDPAERLEQLRKAKLVFSDTFDVETGAWQFGGLENQGQKGSFHAVQGRGEFRLSTSGVSTDIYKLLALPLHGYTYVKVDVWFIQNFPGDMYAVLVDWDIRAGSGRLFAVDGSGQTRYAEGTFSSAKLLEASYTSAIRDGKNTLEVVVGFGRHTLYVNGQVAMDAQAETRQLSYTGLVTSAVSF